MPIAREELAKLIDHTLLDPSATPQQVEKLVAEAQQLGVYSVCISPSMLPLALDLEGLKLATVCGFPSGKHAPSIKAAEARLAVSNGADEIDMVIDLGKAKAKKFDEVEAEIALVKQESQALLKVIIESAALTDEEIIEVCRAAKRSGADFVKTSTGFHPAGGASVHAVELMKQTVGNELGVKASGGIRDWETATKMVAAGATRLGLSGSAVVLAGATD